MRRYQFAALLIGFMWALLWWRTGVLKYLTNRPKE